MILNYLADRLPECGLAPAPGSLARARPDQWMSITLANSYEGELRKNYRQRYVVADVQAVEAAAEACVFENYRLLEAACSEGPYFFGASPTILDFFLWMFINWFEDPEDLRSACPRLPGLADTVMHRPGIDAVPVWAGARRERNAPKPRAERLGCGRRRAGHRPGSTDGSRPNRRYTGNGLRGLGSCARNPGWRAAHAEASSGKP